MLWLKTQAHPLRQVLYKHCKKIENSILMYVVVNELVELWNKKCYDFGIDERGQAANMKQARIYDVLASKQSVVNFATTVACTILKGTRSFYISY